MGFFTSKEHILSNNAMIGEDDEHGDIVWTEADYAYCEAMHKGGVLEHRGTRIINGVHYSLFYLPPPPHLREYEY